MSDINEFVKQQIIQAGNNVPLVYEAGRQSVEDPSKIIEKSETFTTTIALSDISEFPHTVSLSSDEEGATVRYYLNNIYNERECMYNTPNNSDLYDIDVTSRNVVTVEGREGNGTEYSSTAGQSTFYLGKNVFQSGKKYVVSFPAMLMKQGIYSNRLSFNLFFGGTTPAALRYSFKSLNTVERISIIVDATSMTLTENYRSYLYFKINNNQIRFFMEGIVIQELNDYNTGLIYQDMNLPCELSSKENMVFDSSNNVNVNYHRSYVLDDAEKTFWDIAQQHGAADARYRFNGYAWTPRNFKPMYPIEIKDATCMFSNAINLLGDLDEMMISAGKEPLDFSTATCLSSCFSSCRLLRIGTVDTAGLTKASTNIFAANTYLREIRNFVLHQETISYLTTWGTAMFSSTTALRHITFSGDGRIPKSVTFPSDVLTAASIENIVAYLDDTVTGQTLTLKTACKTIYYEAHSDEYADEDTAWNALAATKPNWTIKLN